MLGARGRVGTRVQATRRAPLIHAHVVGAAVHMIVMLLLNLHIVISLQQSDTAQQQDRGCAS